MVWRYDLLQQIATYSEHEEGETTEEKYSSPLEIAAHQFSTIDQLGLKLRDKLWDILLHCINQTRVPMSVLTDCLTIIVSTDAKTDSEHEQVIRSAMDQIHCTSDAGLLRFESDKISIL